MKQTTKHFFLFLVIALVLISCTEAGKRDVDRAVNVFFLGLFQVFNIVLFGISSFILCLLGMTNGKVVLKRIGLVLLILFGLFMLLGLVAVMEQQPKHATVYVLFLFEVAIIGTNVVLLIMKPKGKNSQALYESHRDSGKENDLIDF